MYKEEHIIKDIPLHRPYIGLIYGRFLQSIGSRCMAIGIGSFTSIFPQPRRRWPVCGLRTVSSCPVAITSSAATACEAAELKEGEANWEILWIYPAW